MKNYLITIHRIYSIKTLKHVFNKLKIGLEKQNGFTHETGAKNRECSALVRSDLNQLLYTWRQIKQMITSGAYHKTMPLWAHSKLSCVVFSDSGCFLTMSLPLSLGGSFLYYGENLRSKRKNLDWFYFSSEVKIFFSQVEKIKVKIIKERKFSFHFSLNHSFFSFLLCTKLPNQPFVCGGIFCAFG